VTPPLGFITDDFTGRQWPDCGETWLLQIKFLQDQRLYPPELILIHRPSGTSQ
jgi:hypothetical protein